MCYGKNGYFEEKFCIVYMLYILDYCLVCPLRFTKDSLQEQKMSKKQQLNVPLTSSALGRK